MLQLASYSPTTHSKSQGIATQQVEIVPYFLNNEIHLDSYVKNAAATNILKDKHEQTTVKRSTKLETCVVDMFKIIQI